MRPDWCPEDVWNDTEAYTIEQVGRSAASFHHMMRCRFARAILSERTRCAEIARNWPDSTEGRDIAERIMDDARDE